MYIKYPRNKKKILTVYSSVMYTSQRDVQNKGNNVTESQMKCIGTPYG